MLSINTLRIYLNGIFNLRSIKTISAAIILAHAARENVTNKHMN